MFDLTSIFLINNLLVNYSKNKAAAPKCAAALFNYSAT